jgi:hypothetical protein
VRVDRRPLAIPTGGSRPVERARVGIVASRRETRDDLAHYLGETGFRADTLTALHERDVHADARALVLFPDDFEAAAVGQFLDALRRARPRLLVVVVTRAAGAFERMLAPRAGTSTPVVLPRPPFGWAIVDALRGHPTTGGA